MKAKMLVLAAVAAMVMGLVACGGDAKKTDAPAGGSAEPTPSAAPSAEPSAAPTADPTAAPK